VTPGISSIIALVLRVNRLKRVDFPTLGLPTIAIILFIVFLILLPHSKKQKKILLFRQRLQLITPKFEYPER
jgi:hypothetical protein